MYVFLACFSIVLSLASGSYYSYVDPQYLAVASSQPQRVFVVRPLMAQSSAQAPVARQSSNDYSSPRQAAPLQAPVARMSYGTAGRSSGGYGVSSREESGPPEPYSFGYSTTDEYGTKLHRSEESDGNVVRGSYGYTDPNGVYREVEYVADANGFRAKVKTNEPGTSNASPADVQFLAEAPPSGLSIPTGRSSGSDYGRPRQAVVARQDSYTSSRQDSGYTSARQDSGYASPRQAQPQARSGYAAASHLMPVIMTRPY